jgi:hypothetical protein
LNAAILPAPVGTAVMTSCWHHPCIDLVSKKLWNMSEIYETCLKFVKHVWNLWKIIYCSKYVSESFTSIVNVFMKLVKHFLLFKFVSIIFQFCQKGNKKFHQSQSTICGG